MSRIKKVGVVWGLFLSLLFSPFGQAQPPKATLNFKRIGTEQGLSNSTIECIFQDHRGFMWFGTRDGLNRFDGEQMVVFRYTATDSNTLVDNYITSVAEDSSGQLWIGTLNGICRYLAKTNTFNGAFANTGSTALVMASRIGCIFYDTQHRLWVGTANHGVHRYNHKTNGFSPVSVYAGNQTQPNAINCIYEDSKGNIWAGTSHGLYLYDGNHTLHGGFVPAVNGSATSITAIAEQTNGTIWLGTQSQGLIQYHPKLHTSKAFVHNAMDASSLSSNLVRSMVVDQQDQLWVGSVNGGLDLLDATTGAFINYQNQTQNPRSLSQRTVSSLYEDVQGNLWAGTHRGGVNLYMPGMEKFKHYAQQPNANSLSYNDVKSFCEDRAGNIWIGTDGGGLNRYQRATETFTVYKHDPASTQTIGSNEVIDITEDHSGTLWVGTWGGGLSTLAPGSSKFKKLAIQPSSLYIQKIFEDSRQNIWIGTYYGGLYAYQAATGLFLRITQSQTGKSSVSGNNILSIVEDKAGNMWFGTDDGGLNCLKASTGEFEHYFNAKPKIPDLRVLFADSKGRVWLGQNGLYLYNPSQNSFAPYTQHKALENSLIKSITEDLMGKLWIGTSNSLYELDPQRNQLRAYNAADGLQAMEFEANAVLKTRDGQLYFGGVNGFNTFFPTEIVNNSYKPPVFVTEFYVNNQRILPPDNLLQNDISYTHTIGLSHRQNTFAFSFAALNFTATQNNQFSYRLVGWDKAWVLAGNNRNATYTNVRPGKYTFQVKASNNDGVWNNDGYSIIIIIKPAFWQTWWFRLLLGLVAAGLAWFMYRLRRNIVVQKFEDQKKEAIHQSQLQFFTNISHEFRTPLSLITGPVEKLLKEDAGSKHKQAYQAIQRNANRLLQLINELMDFRKAETGALKLQVMPGSIPLFIHEIAEAFTELAIQKNIFFSVSGSTAYKQVWFDRQVLEKIILNLLSNSFKYTQQGGTVSFQVLDTLESFKPQFENELLLQYNTSKGPFIYFRVADNGIGISKESIRHLFERYYRVSDAHLGSGIGLAFIKTLAQLHKGNIWVYSEYQKGTEMIVAIPVQQASYTNNEQWMRQVETPLRLESLAAQAMLPTNASLEAPATIAQVGEGKEYLVLVADDHEELRGFIKEALEQQYKILEAADGREGMEKTLEYQPDLIISDIMMPVMDGIAYCKLAKTTMETAHIPFILLTAKDSLESRVQGTDTGADYYFSKPISMDLLLLTIRNIFAQKEKLREHYRNDQHAEVKALAHSAKDKQFVEELLAIIENNLSKPEMDIDFVCTEIGMSRTKLYNKVKSITGQPIGDFIRTIRLRKAAALMMQGDGSLTDIMYSVGIQTQSYFSKAFKQEFGKSPTQYLKDMETKSKT
ncbi:MAG: response regulator [Bacteroidetes bacterium]|nr:MAG: response regulator [Bacteroidota bacterium]